jgi:hypothetical protein
MNGYTSQIGLKTRLQNLADQIPQEYRARVISEATQDNPHDMERHLSALVISRRWDAMQIEDEAARVEDWLGEYPTDGCGNDDDLPAFAIGR